MKASEHEGTHRHVFGGTLHGQATQSERLGHDRRPDVLGEAVALSDQRRNHGRGRVVRLEEIEQTLRDPIACARSA